MSSPKFSSGSLATLFLTLGFSHAQSGSGISFPDPTGVSTTYSSTTYNASAASTTLVNDDFSDEKLAFLWNQVGPVATGPVTTTVEPTPEPSSYGNPSGGFHPFIPSYEQNLSTASLPEGFAWGVASSAFQIEVGQIEEYCHNVILLTRNRAPSTPKAKAHRSGTSSATASSTKSLTTPLLTSLRHTITSTSKTLPA
jgi:beta-glucosidase